uniref:Transmembrane ascorbate-dependent reductase CYB561 n=1 Tax=Cyprinodon variegatus TaxID=28743 RepID=A0A3Q2CS23_CYPVA
NKLKFYYQSCFQLSELLLSLSEFLVLLLNLLLWRKDETKKRKRETMIKHLFFSLAILVYRVFRNEAKKHVKLLHGIIHLLALIISIVGIVAVFDFHRAAKIPDMYSLHSWCGMATVILFCLQWVLGLMFFLFPVASSWLRATYLPIHVFSGLTLLVMAIGTSLLGITEKLLFSITYVAHWGGWGGGVVLSWIFWLWFCFADLMALVRAVLSAFLSPALKAEIRAFSDF